MKKNYLLFFALLLFAGAVHARTDITLVSDASIPDTVSTPRAFLDNDIVYVGFDVNIKLPATRKIVAITTENNDTLYLKDDYSNLHRILMNYTGIPDGEYVLNVFYEGFWWKGDFFFKTHKPDGLSVYIDSTYYRLNNGIAVTEKPDINGRTVTHRMHDCFERDYPLHVIIPSELTYEGETYEVVGVEGGSFKYCRYLLSIKLPNTITFIGDCAFKGCANLPQIKIPESVTDIGFAAFIECDKLSYIVIPEGIKTLRNQMFMKCINLSAVTLPNSLVTIEDHAFAGCTSLPYIDIPDNVTYIGATAFNGCKTLMDLKLPANLKTIENNAFFNCPLLASIAIPEGTTSVGAEAFFGCTGLVSVTLPESMEKIGSKAFVDMPNSAHIYCNAKEPFTISANTFNYKCTLHVPFGCKEKYQKAVNWKNFTNIEEMEEESGEPVYGDETGVAPAVLGDDAASDGQFFDLQGRPANGTQKGLYIRNGKKVLVK